MGTQAHNQIIKHGFESDVYVQNSLVHMYSAFGDIDAAKLIFRRISYLDVVSWTSMITGYCKCGDVESARKLFDKMPERNLVTWSIMISGYAGNNQYNRALDLFQILQLKGTKANETIMVTVISSCAHMGALDQGKRAHEYILRSKLTLNFILGTALVDMYAKCGSITEAIRVFNGLPEKDPLSWTTLIAGLAMHGSANKALEYFYKMVNMGQTPRDITFTAVLSACSHGGMVEKGFDFLRA